MFRTRWIRKFLTRQHRHPMAKTCKPVRLRLESLEERLVPTADPTSFVAGNIAVSSPFAGSSTAATSTVTPVPTTIGVPSNVYVTANDNSIITLTMNVNTPKGPATSGAVTVDLVNGKQTIQLGTATVGANGVATLKVTDQAVVYDLAALPSGTYQLTTHYFGNSTYAASSATSTLTLTVPAAISVPPSINVTANNKGTFNVTVNVSTVNGPVTSGFVDLYLAVNGNPITLGKATPLGSNGTATVTVNGSSISSLPPGSYQLVVQYSSGAGKPNSSTTATTLNVLPSAGSNTITPTTTTTTGTTTIVIPGNGVSNFLGGQTTIPIVVNSSLGPVPGGTVTITLLTPTGSEVIGSGPISGGAAAVPVTVPAGLQPGNYSLLESFTDSSGRFLASNATGTLAVQPLNPLIAALELALDAAMIANMNNPGSVGELQMFSQVFLHQPVPTSLPQLLSNIQSLLPQTGSLLFPALEFAGFLDVDLPIENPM